jgi:sugar phosphate permease
MTKVVAENTEPINAERTSIGYTFASFLGSPSAGLLAGFLAWHGVFNTSGIILIVMGIACFLAFTIFEKKKIVQYNLYKRTKAEGGSISVLFKRKIVKFTVVSIITGVVRTSVVFWMPTYFSQHLGFTPEQSAKIFAVGTFVISFSAIIALFIYQKCKRNINMVLFGSFIISAVFFLLLFLVKSPTLNIIIFIIAVMASNSATTMLWSVYCPSLKDTGVVSSATGFLDFASYGAAAVSTVLFANAVETIGWGNLILIWFALMVVGILISIPLKEKSK